MMVLISLLFALSASAANEPISGLPLGTAAATGVNDSFPYVNSTAGITERLKLSDLVNLPAFASFHAATATQLSAVPTGCPGGQYAHAIDSYGNLTCSAPAGGGSGGLIVSTISASATLTPGSPVNYQHVACDASSAPVVATLPACSGNVGQVFNLKKIDPSTNPCSFARSGADLIDGQTSVSNANQFVGISVVCRAAGSWDVL